MEKDLPGIFYAGKFTISITSIFLESASEKAFMNACVIFPCRLRM